MARGLAAAGAGIVVAARNAAKSEAAVRDLKSRGAHAFAVSVDVTRRADVARLVEETVATLGRLDILVNNAGTNIRHPLHELDEADWHTVIDTNLSSAFLCCKAVYPVMKRQGAGKIINIGSMMSIFGASFAPAYAASKGGIVQLTKSLAASWALDSIQVNAVLPGWIETELTEGARAQVAGLYERVVARTPVGRWGQPEHLAGVAVFLASAASDFVTGTAIPVDGGYSIAG